MSTWVKKKTYSQGIQVHTDIVFDMGFFFERVKKIKQETLNGKKKSEIILDDQNTTSCKKYCGTTRKMKKESKKN